MAGLNIPLIVWTLFLAWGTWKAGQLVYNLFFHPLRKFPGPRIAAATDWWKTYIEVYTQESMTDVLIRLHQQYGDVIRVAPNELHFGNPDAFYDIYNSHLRWDKERKLYESFGEDHSSFGFLTYAEANDRKDVLRPLFSRRAILNMQWLVHKNASKLISALTTRNASSHSSDLLFAFRCFSMDTITAFCFAQSVSALSSGSTNFRAPIVEAMDLSLSSFPLFRHFPLLRKLVFSVPPHLLSKLAPDMAGLTNLQILLGEQVREVLEKGPEALERKAAEEGAHEKHETIYHRLIDPKAYEKKGGTTKIPDATSLYEEAQTMLFAGSVTVGDALNVGFYHVLAQPELYRRLKEEVRGAWGPDAGGDGSVSGLPSLEVLEALPLLSATVKESLRHSPAVASPLLRVVPPSFGVVTIGGHVVPAGTVVGMSTVLVHMSPRVFGEDAAAFRPERWLDTGAKLDGWLVPFSKGPRSCLGLNLAYAEVFTVFAVMLGRFEMELDGTTAEDMAWRDCFTPHFYRRHLHAWCRPVMEEED